MADKKFVPIKYTSRDFSSIKQDLIEYTKRYYPDTFKDFNEASFGSLMLDTVAYAGDILSFYLDYQANESFIDTSIEYDNVLRLARQMGYKFQNSPVSTGAVSLFLNVPANANGIGPDSAYMPILKRGTQFNSSGGSFFLLTDDVDFSNADNEVVVSAVNDDTGVPTYYAIKASGKVTSGKLGRESVGVGDFQKFRKIQLDDESISEILSVFDSEGNAYFEVDHLSQNVIYLPVINRRTDRNVAPNLLKPFVVARRFTVEQEAGKTFLQFGYGSNTELSNQSIADPSDVVLDVHGRTHVTDASFDPTKLTATDKFGIAPANTSLVISYRTNTGQTVNAAARSLNSVTAPVFQFTNRIDLDATQVSIVEGSIEVTNEERIVGDVSTPTIDEIRQRAKSHFATQNRAVTREDYISLIYAMPQNFGAVKRCMLEQDRDAFKRNLNLYVVSENTAGQLVNTSDTIKENVKVWLNRHRMINDTIDILPAHIVNIGIEFSVLADDESNKFSVLQACVQRLTADFAQMQMNIGEGFSITGVYKSLNNVLGVADTIDVKIVRKSGTLYSDVPFNVESYTSMDGRTVLIPDTHIFEIKFPTSDIQGVVK